MGNPSQSGLPLLNSPFLGSGGHVTFPWYAFLTSLHQKTGGATPAANAVTLQQNTDGTIEAVGPTGQDLGPIATTGQTAEPVVELTPVVSPFIYQAPTNGWIVADATTTLAISRDGGLTYYQTSAVGGQLVMLKGDRAQVTWAAGIPSVVWFGGNT
jgi:hypothetical protein